MNNVRLSRRSLAVATTGAVAFGLFTRGFAQEGGVSYEAPADIADLTGEFEADGSSTLGPLTEAAIEEFATVAPNVRITNGISGSGGGFERFANGEIAISNASRPIKNSEAAIAAENGISWYRFSMAYDGITVVVSAENDFVDELTVEELQKIWQADGGVTTWADVREGFPDEPIELYGPGTASGTFDYFNEEILGDLDVRTDYTPSEDDNVLVQGVAGSPYALGYFGFSYFEENQDILKAVAVDNGDGPVAPSIETIADGSYAPLSRTLYIYVNADELQNRPEVAEFVKFYAASVGEIAPSVGYIALPEEAEQETYDAVVGAIDGSRVPDSESFGTPEASPAASPAS
ncbi:MAG TPA: PstS family phosphate ABC transporter substrate-binding protein [Thermomicrobiales bacterium]|nr:PstS family phosphate ABC transporter substrate-binding protein [Thermomicrobiales bacterium]